MIEITSTSFQFSPFLDNFKSLRVQYPWSNNTLFVKVISLPCKTVSKAKTFPIYSLYIFCNMTLAAISSAVNFKFST